MIATILEQLSSEHIRLLTACLTTVSALRDRLMRLDEVRAVRKALEAGELSEEAVRSYVADLMKDLKAGQSFSHDSTLAALAVALEPLASPLADELLRDLAQLQLAEMGLSIRVARECLKHRETVSTRPAAPVPVPTASEANGQHRQS